MDPQRFELVQEILAMAMERPADERAAFIDVRCGDDVELRSEVESLLEASENAGDFFDSLAGRAGVAGPPEGDTSKSLVGRTVSHFEITGELGRGGMGTVYRATDVRLGREVALKVMPEFLSRDSEQLARFQREARVLAKLNHPGIGAIYDLEEVDGRRVLVLEMVEGLTLRDRAKKSRLSLDEALMVARHIATALEAAHAAGIVHRDLKPANVMIRPDGEVKVLDFGIAKGLEKDKEDEDECSPSPSKIAAATRIGRIMGTVAYMSPEQARGRHVDHRSDVWSFGVVLFEMLAGRRPFSGEDTAQTLARILEGEPDWKSLPRRIPDRIRRLLERCLVKDPRQRLQAIGEARIGIDAHLADPTPEVPGTASRPLSRWFVALTVGLAAVAGWMARPSGGGPGEPRNMVLYMPDGAAGTRLSPDGTRLFYTFDGEGWLLAMDQPAPRRLPGTDGALNPFWTGDSESVVFRRDDKLWRAPVGGAGAQIICDLPPGVYTGGTWIEGDTILFAMPEGIFQVPAGGGTPELLLARDMEREASFREPHGIPGGGFLFAAAMDGRIESMRGGERDVLLQLEETMVRDPLYSAPGHLVFRRMDRGGEIWAVPFSLSAGATSGEPFLIEAVNAVPTVSRGGTLAYRRPPVELHQMGWIDESGRLEGSVSEPQLRLSWPAISPDGTRIAVSAVEGGRRNLWIHDIQSGSVIPFTLSADERHRYPFWSADGARVGFSVSSTLSGWLAVKATGTDVDVAQEILAPGGVGGTFSPDGRYLVYQRLFETTGADLLVRTLGGTDDQPFHVTRQHEGWPRLSPDGALVAHQGGRTGFPEIIVRPFPTGSGFWQVSTDTGRHARWSPDGSALYYWQGRNIMVVSVDRTGGSPRFGRPELFVEGASMDLVGESYDVAPDGRLLVVRRLRAGGSDVPSGMVLSENWAGTYPR